MPLACATEAINPNKTKTSLIGEFLTRFTPTFDTLITKSSIFRTYNLVTGGPPADTNVAFVLRSATGNIIAYTTPYLLSNSNLGLFSNTISTIKNNNNSESNSYVLEAGVDYYIGILFRQNYQVFLGSHSNAFLSDFASNIPFNGLIINDLPSMTPLDTVNVGWGNAEETGLRLFVEIISQ
jgi:hypothetical protein